MAALPRRILKETQKLTQDPVPGIEAIPDEKNARYFHIKVYGPADSPYENGKHFKYYAYVCIFSDFNFFRVFVCITFKLWFQINM